MSLLELFCEVDDFYQGFALCAHKQQLASGVKRGPKCRLSANEVMTIMIHFHESGYRNFKTYYQQHVCKQYLRIKEVHPLQIKRFQQLRVVLSNSANSFINGMIHEVSSAQEGLEFIRLRLRREPRLVILG